MKIKSYIPISLTCIILIIIFILLLFFKYHSEHPKTEWDTSPDKVIISYQVFREIEYGYIPDFQIWGDGHIVWVKNSYSTREVYEGYLTQGELKKLIDQFIDVGYYNWFGNHGESYESISIKLTSRPYYDLPIDSNKEISNLVDYLRTGAGLEAKEFVPSIGYLYVLPIEETEYSIERVIPVPWTDDNYQINFENFKQSYPNGQELTGEELNFVWSIVNGSSFIESNGKIYRIALLIPKITY